MKNQRILYEFDDFRVDSGQFMLVKQGRAQPLTPTVFRILLLLLESGGEVVTKEKLVSTVWPDSFVEEGNLNRNVSTLRKALGETPSDHRYIETVPKTGYRFIAPIRRVEFQPASGSAATRVQVARKSLVGRDTERKILLTAFDRVKDGHGGIVCVSGEIGIGKTAVADAFLADLAARKDVFHFATARCSEPMTPPEPYGPFIECLSGLAKAEGIVEIVHREAPTWHREIARTNDENTSGSAAATRMKREMSELLQQMSRTHPVVLVIDDFHWADVASVELVTFLAARLTMMRVLVVVCVRPAELSIHKHAFLQVRSQLAVAGLIQEIALPPLTKDHIREHLAKEYPQRSFPEDLPGFVLARSEGNPLFAGEIIRSLKLDAGFAKRQDALPESLRSMIRSRLEPLAETDRGLLAAASVQGHEFDSAILAKSLSMKPEDVEERLQAICEVHGLILRLREEELMDGKFTVRYSFAHSLYQIVCQELLPPTRKAALNSAVAEAFLAYYGN